ncbi:MAG: NusB antitermination factor [Acidimicrobiales bacterium]|nr:NusB antitermination factor [Acidimicrobiales bacterium]
MTFTPSAGPRRQARERALGLLYEAEAKDMATADLLAELPVEPDPYAATLVGGVGRHLDEIDGWLARLSRDWTVERMPAVDRALLRMAAYELLHEPTVPTGAVIDEAVELAKSYSTESSGRFVNGVLSKLADECREPSP